MKKGNWKISEKEMKFLDDIEEERLKQREVLDAKSNSKG